MGKKKRSKNSYPPGTTIYTSECGCRGMVNVKASYFGFHWCQIHKDMNMRHVLPQSFRLLAMLAEIKDDKGELKRTEDLRAEVPEVS